MGSDKVLLSFFLLHWSLKCLATTSRDTLIAGQNISVEGNLVSSNQIFELGFFLLNSSSSVKRYLGIWYNDLEPRTVVWVANRDKPVLETSAVFKMAEDGNLVVEVKSERYWSSKLVGSSSSGNRTVKLLDSGNLVLMDDKSGTSYLWQSFQNPTDTFLPGMKMNSKLMLISWTDANDPATGDFTFTMPRSQSLVVKKQSQLHWTVDDERDTGAISSVVYGLLENTTSGNTSNPNDRITDKVRAYSYEKSRLLMNSSGEIQFLKWNEAEKQWGKTWSMPADKCDIYNHCGSFGICNKKNNHRCKCLPGWYDKNEGCVRKSISCIDKDFMFLNLTKIKVDDPYQEFVTGTEEECRSKCLNISKCPESQCKAYSYNTSTYDRDSGFKCKIWTRDLSTLVEDYDRGLDISILVNKSDIETTAKTCQPCGTYVIPYPLSTGLNCGDPTYKYFNCSSSAGDLSFMMPRGRSYKISEINEDARVFFIETDGLYSCSSTNQNHIPNFPFNVFASDCLQDFGVVKITWQPAPEPPCTNPIDCISWPHSTCTTKTEGGSRCLCDSNYKWNDSFMICTTNATQELSRQHSTRRTALILTGIAILALACIVAFSIVRRKRKALKRDRASIRIQESLNESERHVKDLIGLGSLEENDIEGIEVPCYTFESILAATNNFSDSNKLGRGGYGPVYKGTFPGGQDIAVKRLSSVSAQGLQEFKNEVILIAKLQHRNLVRLRGYCVKGGEKILLYEYMPNKSLDSFIFDRTRTTLLDWPTRFEIIIGIVRGLLYLHQDSRLRVIHRDMKTSNILLDNDMNPKISDFGLAKIFGGKETEASTERVVGTYGYMAPEYALDGLFSTKSDIFSFGVVILEILSGKRNTGFYQSKQISSILGYAWKLWTENKLLDLMDLSLGETCNENQFIKCAIIGLLCVQDEPGDRPTMSNVLTILESKTASMPIPKQPTFFVNKGLPSSASSSNKPEVTLQFDSSYQEGR